ncbi:MAG: Na+/H+ antiporter NhaA, partial [Bdellovibrionales bacterium]|nr:Na+/H+ antiporter NhaA [Bdellovibrionales bacterium]
VIAIFYTKEISTDAMIWASCGLVVVAFLRFSGIRNLLVYSLLGVLVWYAILRSGVHATVAGVLLGLMTPIQPLIRKKEAPEKIKKLINDLSLHLSKIQKEDAYENQSSNEYLDERAKSMFEELHQVSIEARSPLDRLVHMLHPIVSFVIMPIFAFTNAGIEMAGLDFDHFIHNPISLGIILGLFVGKPLGILSFAWLSTKMKLAQLPTGISWFHITCMGCLGGIGFTMALFVSHLALKTPDLEVYSKLGIIVASILSALVGLALLSFAKKTPST